MNTNKVTQGRITRHYNLAAVIWFEYDEQAPGPRGAMAAIARAGKASTEKSEPRIRIGFQGTTSVATVCGAEATHLFEVLAAPPEPPATRRPSRER